MIVGKVSGEVMAELAKNDDKIGIPEIDHQLKGCACCRCGERLGIYHIDYKKGCYLNINVRCNACGGKVVRPFWGKCTSCPNLR
jgi:hypothetical protein